MSCSECSLILCEEFYQHWAQERVEEIWQEKNEIRSDYDWIPLYYRYRESNEPDTVDDKTWADLEMEEVFARLPRA